MSGVGRRLRRGADLRQAGVRDRARRHPAARPPLRDGRGAAVGADPACAAARSARRARSPSAPCSGPAATPSRPALYFGALKRIDAGLASLLLYAYPAFVTVAAFALRRESPTRRKLGRARARLGRRRARADRGRRGRGRLARRRDGDRLGRVLHRASSSPPTASRPTRRPCPYTASVATGAALSLAVAALLGGGIHASGEGVMWAAVIARRLDGDADRPVHGRARARRALDRLDRLDGRTADHRRARMARVRRDARPAPAGRRRARALGAWCCSSCGAVVARWADGLRRLGALAGSTRAARSGSPS